MTGAVARPTSPARSGAQDPPALVDVHAHLVTDEYVAAVEAAGGAADTPDGMPAWPAWSARDHVDLMDAHGIARSVLSVSSPGVHFGDDGAARDLAAHVDDVAAKACRDHPDRFSFFTALPLPDVAGCLAQLRRGVDELGAVGAAVESNAAGAYLGDPAFEPLWDELDVRGAVLFVHPTSPPGWERTALGQPRPVLEFLADTTRTVADLLRARTLVRHPRVEVVVPHCGAFLPVEADRLQLFLGGTFAPPGPAAAEDPPDVVTELSRLWYDLAGTPMPRHAPALAALVGTDRLLYGSDFCFTPPAGVAAQVASLDARWDEVMPPGTPPWRELAGANAARLLDLDHRPQPGSTA